MSERIRADGLEHRVTISTGDNPTSITIVGATIGLATDLEMACVVERVETIEQLNALPHNPDLLVQGFLYAEPQPVKDGLPSYLHATSAELPGRQSGVSDTRRNRANEENGSQS